MVRSFKVEAVHKQMYPATYNFRDDVDGSEPEGWTSSNDAGSTTTIIASLDRHRKVLDIYDGSAAANEGAHITQTFSAQISGTIEFLYRTTDKTKKSEILGSGNSIHLFVSGGNLIQFDGGGQTIVQAINNNQWYHIKLVFDCAPDTYDIYIDGILKLAGEDFESGVASITSMVFRTEYFVTADTWSVYVDALGYSWDVNYNVGDNCFWRHYKESTDSFEGDDVGTQGTAITWVDAALTTAAIEVFAEFDEHKKYIRQIESAGDDWSYHTFATQAKTGWVAFWFRVSDVEGVSLYMLYEDTDPIVELGIEDGMLKWYDGNTAAWIESGITMVNNTWYHIYVQWYDGTDDSYDVWLNNVLVADGVQTHNNMTSGINRFLLQQLEDDSLDLDAPISSLDGDSRGDNRLFDYNSTYTKKDITTDIVNVLYKNTLGKYREADMYAKTSYESTEIFVQVYDCNSKLAMEAELKKRDQTALGRAYIYVLMDKNRDDLDHESSNTFSAAAIHDPTDSTSMLKVILPNVSETDGDLILVNADTKADTYSPTTINYPDYKMLLDISDLSDSIVIIEANGKCHLDDDLASGTELDLDVEADKNKMTDSPLVSDVLDTLNYFEVRGAINPDTGARWYKIIDNTGDDKKRSWRITNNNFNSQADVDAYAAKLVTKSVPIRNVTFWVQDVGAHDMGTTIKYDFVNAAYSVPEGNYYVIFEGIDFDRNKNTIILSEGVIEESLYAAENEREADFSNSYASSIYETDITTIVPYMHPYNGAAWAAGHYVELNAANEGVLIGFYIPSNVDDERDMMFDIAYRRNDANNDTVSTIYGLWIAECNGVNTAWTAVWDAVADTLPADAQTVFNNKTYTLSASDITPDSLFYFLFTITEAARVEQIWAITIRYHTKRSI